MGEDVNNNGFCVSGVQELYTGLGPSTSFLKTTLGQIGGYQTKLANNGEYQVVHTCAGEAVNLQATSNIGYAEGYNLQFDVIEGQCDGLNCNDVPLKGQSYLDCAVHTNNLFAVEGFADFLPDENGRYKGVCPTTSCNAGYAESTLPLGFGGGVGGFNPVIPRSNAYGDYVSSTYFKDNFDESSNFVPDQVFIGYYLTRKIVDGECVMMLCPTKPGTDNYCRALPDCNL